MWDDVRQVPGNSEERRSATKADVLEWIYARMRGGESYKVAREAASQHFEVSERIRAEVATRAEVLKRREEYVSGLQEEAARSRTLLDTELEKVVTDKVVKEPVDDATDDEVVPRAVSRFEVIEIEGIESRPEKKEGNNGENESNEF